MEIYEVEYDIIGTKIGLEDLFVWTCYDQYGNFKWTDTIANLVVNAGLNDALDKYFNGSAYTATHYTGLTDGTPTVVAGDTMSSHSGWVEITAYNETTRPLIIWGTVSGQSVNNNANKAVFTINADSTTIGGGFITTINTKGGTTGTLYGAGAFTGGDKILGVSDVLNVGIVASAAAT